MLPKLFPCFFFLCYPYRIFSFSLEPWSFPDYTTQFDIHINYSTWSLTHQPQRFIDPYEFITSVSVFGRISGSQMIYANVFPPHYCRLISKLNSLPHFQNRKEHRTLQFAIRHRRHCVVSTTIPPLIQRKYFIVVPSTHQQSHKLLKFHHRCSEFSRSRTFNLDLAKPCHVFEATETNLQP